MSDGIKQKAFTAVKERGLYSCMNDTKWNELRQAMLNEMPFPPIYVIKSLLNDDCSIENEIYKDSIELGEWYYFGETVDIEWVKIRPRRIKPDRSVEDESGRLEELLRKYNIPYEKSGDVFCIYGYR